MTGHDIFERIALPIVAYTYVYILNIWHRSSSEWDHSASGPSLVPSVRSLSLYERWVPPNELGNSHWYCCDGSDRNRHRRLQGHQ